MANELTLANLLDRVVPERGTTVPPVKNFRPGERLGVQGVSVVGGYLQENVKDAKLSGRQKYVTYSDWLLDVTILATGVRYFTDLVASAQWTVEPADDEDPAAKEAADFVEDCLDDMATPFWRVVKRASMFKFYGFSLHEWIAKPRDDGRIGFHDTEPRPQSLIEQWDCDERGILQGVVQRTPITGQFLYIPRNKLVYIVDDTLDTSPQGAGLFRHMARPSSLLTRLEDLETWGFETDLRGIPIGRGPISKLDRMVQDGTLTKAEAAAQRGALETFILNHIRGPRTGLLLDSVTYQTTDERSTPSAIREWDLELLQAGGSSHAEVGAAIQRKQMEIARLLCVEHLMYGGQRQTGSHALGQTGAERMYLTANGTLKEIGDSCSIDYIRPLMVLNGFDKKVWPKLKAAEISFRSVEELTKALSDLATAGAPLMPNDPAIGEIRDLVGLSRPENVDPMNLLGGNTLPLNVSDLEAALGPAAGAQPNPTASGGNGLSNDQRQ